MPDHRQLALGLFLHPTGHHVAGWRHPDARADAATSLAHHIEIARLAERGRFDFLFLSDTLALGRLPGEALSRTALYVVGFQPTLLLSALAAVTGRIGLVATLTTTYNEPYHIARQIASLDLLSGGRAGWNLVTSANSAEAANFGTTPHPPHAGRYDRAREAATVVRGLWQSWAADAFRFDQRSGRYFDPAGLRPLNHDGDHFSVRGPLNVAPSPQGSPVLVQAGSSEAGIDLAAATAEVVFTAQPTIEEAQAFYRTVQNRLAAYGRDPAGLRIMPGLSVVVAPTRAAAEAKFQQLQDLVQPEVGLALLSMFAGIDLSGHDPDGPLPPLPDSNTNTSRVALLRRWTAREPLTLRQLYLRFAGARGHASIVGAPGDIADHIEQWFHSGAADGFNIMPPYLPGGLNDFVDLVIPELQRRGLFRSDYHGTTLRSHLGLPHRPVERLSAP